MKTVAEQFVETLAAAGVKRMTMRRTISRARLQWRAGRGAIPGIAHRHEPGRGRASRAGSLMVRRRCSRVTTG
jgi:hypothetical protein